MFYGNYSVEIPVGERKIFLKTKTCYLLQLSRKQVKLCMLEKSLKVTPFHRTGFSQHKHEFYAATTLDKDASLTCPYSLKFCQRSTFERKGKSGRWDGLSWQKFIIRFVGSSPNHRGFLFKIKACEKNSHPSTICRTYGAGRHLVDISRIYSPPNFGELIFWA